jgi:hypothetical protein
MTIGKHLATFNVFREPDGLYITIADARGVQDELGESGAPLRLCAMPALRSALKQMDIRDAQRIEARSDETQKAVQPEGREPDGEADASSLNNLRSDEARDGD